MMVPAGLRSGRSPTRLMQKRFQIIRQISGGVEGVLVSMGNLPEEILGPLEAREMQLRFCVHEIMCGRRPRRPLFLGFLRRRLPAGGSPRKAPSPGAGRSAEALGYVAAKSAGRRRP